jgi:orotidine-5'-phosphate decarboxylase
MTTLPGFATRLRHVFGEFGHLCVGIDPHPFLLKAWGYDDSIASLKEFSLRCLDASVDQVGLIKPQVAFYERYGSAGFAVLEELIRRARSAGIQVISDAKRGDIGTTMDAYTASWLGAGSPLESDAVTVSPYLGVAALQSAFATADANGKGVFVLAATSNPEAAGLQQAHTDHGTSVAANVLADVASRSLAATDPGSFGVVLGATLRLEKFGIDTASVYPVPVLAPGFGAQGAQVRDARGLFGALAQNLIVAQTRSILEVGPDGVREAIKREQAETADALA